MSTDIAIGNEYASTRGLVVTIINIRPDVSDIFLGLRNIIVRCTDEAGRPHNMLLSRKELVRRYPYFRGVNQSVADTAALVYAKAGN